MKVLLVYPPFLDARLDEADVSAVPMGLYFIGAMLRANGVAVEILNGHRMAYDAPRIRRLLADTQPDVVGFSILHANRWGGIDIARLIKQVDPRITVVFGGVGATFLWRHLLTHFTDIDYVVRGEGEHTFLELVRFLGRRLAAAPAHIDGLAFRRNGRPFCNADRMPVADLDSLPRPADYFTFQHVALTRGCPMDCTFCGSPALWQRRVRFHRTDTFVAQLATLRRKGVRSIFVSDDTFTLDRERVIAICRQIIDRGLDIVWSAISRVDCVDQEMLVWMRRAGCTQISYGVESGSRRIRAIFRKRISDDHVCRAFDMTVRCGILARAYFIYGAPGESDRTIDATLALLERIRPLAAIFYMLTLFPGTALYDDYQRRSGAGDDIWLDRVEDLPYVDTDDRLSRPQVVDFGRRLREGFFARLPAFAAQVELIEDPDLYPLHADFLSRLALTFSHGDYATNPQIPDRLSTAVTLFERSLRYHPDHRAFWGLGLVYQQQRRLAAAVELWQRGIAHHPHSIDLRLALANGLMRLNRHAEARRCLEVVSHHDQVVEQLVRCCRVLGDREGERRWVERLTGQRRH